MIQKFSFLGMSLYSKRRRRGLVVAYYLVIASVMALAFWRERFLGYGFVTQTLMLGGFFGGIRAEGVIKPYSEQTPDPAYSGIQELNLSGIRSRSMPKLLDEREIHERNQAHYTAYRLLRWLICGITVICILGTAFRPDFLLKDYLTLLWGITILVLSLPQSVILWTEPDPLPEGDLTLVPQP
jgi:hypothetical protein